MPGHDPYRPPQDVTIFAATPPPGQVRRVRVSVALLLLLAGSAHAAWLGEVFAHGWAGLTWLTYVHWAVPVAILGMIAWLLWMAALPRRLAVPYTITLSAFAVIGCLSYQFALSAFFATGSLGIPLVTNTPWDFARLAILPLLLLTAPTFFALVRWFTGRPTLRWAGLGTGLFVLSPLLGLLVMTLATPFDDLIHVIKSGAAIPGFILALGLPCMFPLAPTPTNKAARVGRLSR